MATPRLSFSLRGHSSQVVCSTYLESSFISADSSGHVFWWDLNVKRPKRHWKAHESHILSLIYIKEYDILLTHSRDSSIRLWFLSEPEVSDSIPPFKEFPVNSLNFCNVSLISSRYLLTPSTVDSDNFDIYDLNLADSSSSLSFTRLVHNANPWELYLKALKSLPVPLDDDISKRDKFGIMMRTVWVDEHTFYVAYESGHVIGYNIEYSTSKLTNSEKGSSKSTSLLNKGPKINIFHISDKLKPSPIISLIYEKSNNTIITGSASKSIQILEIPSSHGSLTEDENNLISLKYSGLSQISMLEPDIIVVGFWNGIVKGYQSNLKFEEVFKLEKNLPMIDTNDESQSQRLKLSSISCKGSIKEETGAAAVVALSQKDLLRSKRNVSNKILMAIGYENGLINMYEF
ncbi:ASTRA-associated protein 1 [[Candida] railenensis]|uniref:ASTRA-associated protein 1 n=1 Tax=[Candida] railenensis TaxID=45579 RepID=A0A9P0VW09_9ASCO|nr:ASTRA-associated protein 1 [[Candida] railenensis]